MLNSNLENSVHSKLNKIMEDLIYDLELITDKNSLPQSNLSSEARFPVESVQVSSNGRLLYMNVSRVHLYPAGTINS